VLRQPLEAGRVLPGCPHPCTGAQLVRDAALRWADASLALRPAGDAARELPNLPLKDAPQLPPLRRKAGRRSSSGGRASRLQVVHLERGSCLPSRRVVPERDLDHDTQHKADDRAEDATEFDCAEFGQVPPQATARRVSQ
jgi:hypothetical protein